MLKNLEKLENSKVKLEIEVAEPDVDTALAKAYFKVVKKVNLPGFRKGKIPRRILEARFGPEILHDDALEMLIPHAYQEAIKNSEVEPVDQPQFELVQMEEGKPLIFHALVDVLPEIELSEYKGIKVEQEEVKVDDLQIDHHLYMLREQNARLVPLEDSKVKEGHQLLIDFKGFIDDEPFEGGEAENYSLEIGSKSFIEGFEEQLVGAAIDEEREVRTKFPENYHKQDLAGKDVLFRVTVKEIKEKQLPDIDDEFFKEVSEFETFDELKEDLRVKLLKNAEEQSKMKMEESLISIVSESSKLELPLALVERQIDRIIGDLESYLQYQGLNLDKFLELSGKSMEEIREEKREDAEKRTRANLVLDAVSKKEGINIEDSELDAKIASIAEEYNDKPDRIRDILDKQGRLPVIREELRIRKTIDMLVLEAQVKKVKAKKKPAGTGKSENKQTDAKKKATPKTGGAKKNKPSKPAEKNSQAKGDSKDIKGSKADGESK